MPITPLPTPVPSRADPANFAARGDTFLGALPTFATEANALAVEVNENAAICESAAQTVNVSEWVSGTTYAVGANRFDPVTFLTYRRKTAGAGTTRPGLDGTNWQLLTGFGDVDLSSTQTVTNKTLGAGSAWGGNAIPVANGGTGSTTAAAARTALGLAIGTNVLAPNGNGAGLTGVGRRLGQIQQSFSGAVATGTTQTPWDDSIPQITEGDQYYTVTITPQNAASLLEIEVVMNVSCASPAQNTVALHQDSISDALAATTAWNSAGAQPVMGVIKHYVAAGSTTARTYRVRVGNNAASTVTVNGSGGARRYGGVLQSGISVKEYLP